MLSYLMLLGSRERKQCSPTVESALFPLSENSSSAFCVSHSHCGTVEKGHPQSPEEPTNLPTAHCWIFSWCLFSQPGLAGGWVRDQRLKSAPFLLLLMFSAVNSFLFRIITSFQEGRAAEGIRRKFVASEDCFISKKLRGRNPKY